MSHMKGKRLLIMSAGFLAAAWPSACHQVDWAKLFEDLSSGNPALVHAATERFVDVIAPEAMTEKPESLAAEMPAVVTQLNRQEDAIRTRASGLLAVLAQLRPDSAVVLSAAIPALIDHAQDPVGEVSRNALSTLCMLRPVIPHPALQFLVSLVEGQNESLAIAASSGVARMADARVEAADALEKAIEVSSTRRKIAVIGAIGDASVTDARLVSRLGTLLANHDETVVRAALDSMGKLGSHAITLNSPQISNLADTSSDKDLAGIARQLLKREPEK